MNHSTASPELCASAQRLEKPFSPVLQFPPKLSGAAMFKHDGTGSFPRAKVIPMERFPFRSHRTMADVAETEALSRLRRTFHLEGGQAVRLDALQNRADINNPPPKPSKPPQGAA